MEKIMKQLSNLKTNVNIKTRILIFTGLLALFLVLSSGTVNGRGDEYPVLTVVKSASPTSYNAVGQTITYSYFVTNSGNVDLTGKINVIDNLTGTIPISTNGISSSSSLIQTNIYTITQADIDAGSVTNSAYATGSFYNQPVISPNTTATVIHE
jgi:uncharacterized repeat protein (TIGR01451 family)